MPRRRHRLETGGAMLRAYRLSHVATARVHGSLMYLSSVARAVHAGLWLGLLNRDQLLAVADEFYSNHERYRDHAYNLSGLQQWETTMMDRFFVGRRRILLVGAGAGREVVALAERGHRVHAYECNARLVAAAKELVSLCGVNARVDEAPPDACPQAGGVYDGLIVGWGAYMLIAGRDRRIALLRSMRAQAKEGAPLLLSFFVRRRDSKRFHLIHLIGNSLRRFRSRPPLELGDDLEPEFVHYFTREELEGELTEGGFALAMFNERPYGHALARAV